MHQKKEGKILRFFCVLSEEIERSIYASIAAFIVEMVVNCLRRVKNRFDVLVKKEKNKEEFTKELNDILKSYRVKIIIFFILDVSIMLFCCYYCMAWCAFYYTVQLELIYSIIISICLSFIFGVFVDLFITLMRYLGMWLKLNLLFNVAKLCA